MSIWHWLVVLAVVLLLFGGRGKLSGLMGDVAEGIKAFKKGMQGDDEKTAQTKSEPLKTIDHAPTTAASGQPATNQMPDLGTPMRGPKVG